jgi:hypothetical protein
MAKMCLEKPMVCLKWRCLRVDVSPGLTEAGEVMEGDSGDDEERNR